MNKLVFPFLALALLASDPASAQRISDIQNTGGPESSHASEPTGMPQGIVAVVNDAIISSSDLKARTNLAILSAGMPNSAEAQHRLLPQVLRGLIDEQLQLQEGKKQGITVTNEEINKTMKQIAEDNRIPGGDMPAFLRANGIPPSSLKTQIKATMTWNRVIAREIRPRIDIGDDEIEAAIQRMRANAGKQEYLVSEIFLAVDKPEEELQVRQMADKLVEQIKGGVVFGAAARQFSQGLGASNGGDIGWVQMGQMAPEIDKVLPTLHAKEVAGPIRTAAGFHILGIREKRTISVGDPKDMSVKLEQIFRPFTPDTEREALLREAKTIRKNVTDCSSLQQIVNTSFPQWKWQSLGDVKMDKAPTWLAEKIATIPDGQGGEPMATDKGALVIFVCSRTASENIDKNALRSTIGGEKMELLARRHLRDLRKSAFIDVRVKVTP